MSIRLDASATIPVRQLVYSPQGGSTTIGSGNPVEMKIKDIVVAAFAAIPSQATAITTVATVVTALNTIP